MSARDHVGQERRSSGPGMGFSGEQAAEVIEFLRAVKGEHERLLRPGRWSWLLKPGLAAGVFGALLSAQILAGMAGCQRVMATAQAMDSHVLVDARQHESEAQERRAVGNRLERIETDVRWLVSAERRRSGQQ